MAVVISKEDMILTWIPENSTTDKKMRVCAISYPAYGYANFQFYLCAQLKVICKRQDFKGENAFFVDLGCDPEVVSSR